MNMRRENKDVSFWGESTRLVKNTSEREKQFMQKNNNILNWKSEMDNE